MSRTIHADSALTSDYVVELLSYNESEEMPGLTRRFLSLGDAVLIEAFIFLRRDGTKRCRFAKRLLAQAEKALYRTERLAVESGSFI